MSRPASFVSKQEARLGVSPLSSVTPQLAAAGLEWLRVHLVLVTGPCKEDGLLPPLLTSFRSQIRFTPPALGSAPSVVSRRMRMGCHKAPRQLRSCSPRPGGLLGALVVFNGEMQWARGRRQEGSAVRRALASTLATLGWRPGSCVVLCGRKPAAQFPSNTNSEPSTGSV